MKECEAEKLRQIINIDVEFLCSLKFMDYSLLVIKADWGNYLKSQDSREEVHELFTNPY